jgi:hypothetical protein
MISLSKNFGILFQVVLILTCSMVFISLHVAESAAADSHLWQCYDEIVATSSAGKTKDRWPKYSKLRFTEDYSFLASKKNTPSRDVFDKLKFIPLSDDNNYWLSLGGQARMRAEGFSNFNFGAPAANDDDFHFLQRYHFNADLHLGQHFRAFVQTRNAFVSGHDLPESRLPDLEDEFDIQNAFGDMVFNVRDESQALLRVGRFEQTFGSGRMFGCREWRQLRSPLDGAKFRVSGDEWSIDTFWAYATKTDRYDWMSRDEDQKLWGLYGHIHNSSPSGLGIEPYLLVKQRSVNDLDIDRYNLGLRLFGMLKGLGVRYDVEGAYQFGDADKKVQAWFAAIELTKALKDIALAPAFTVGFDYASGDDDPQDDTIKTFEALQPYGHYYFGYADMIGRQNLISPFLRAKFLPTKKVMVNLEGHWFWVAQEADALYSPCNCSKPVRKGSADAGSYTGFEMDAFVKASINHHLSVLVGCSYLTAGEFLEDTEGPSDNVTRWYTQVQYTF